MTKFYFSNYPHNFGEYVRFDSGKFAFGDWERDFVMPKAAVRDLYEALREHFEPADD